MNVIELREAYIGMWPNRVRIDDAYASGSGFIFPTLNEAHDAIEDRIDYHVDNWGTVFTWAMFQACHEYARALLKQGVSEMLISDIPVESLDQWIIKSLAGEDWSEERAVYEPLL